MLPNDLTIAEYTKWTRASLEQFEFFRRAGKDVSFDVEEIKTHVEAYATDNGLIIGRIMPLDEWRREQEKAEDRLVDQMIATQQEEAANDE